MGINEAVKILECMAINFAGALGGLSETNPMVDVIRQRIDAIDTVKNEIQKAINQSEDYRQIAEVEAIKEFSKMLKTYVRNKNLYNHEAFSHAIDICLRVKGCEE